MDGGMDGGGREREREGGWMNRWMEGTWRGMDERVRG